MDGEMSSSHGDFPIPVKNYKKLASQMIELFLTTSEKVTEERLQSILTAVFEVPQERSQTESSIPKIDLVFPQQNVDKTQLEKCIQTWLSTKVSEYSNNTNINELKKNNTLDKMFAKNNIRELNATKKKNKKTNDENRDDNADIDETDTDDEDNEDEDNEDDEDDEDDENKDDHDHDSDGLNPVKTKELKTYSISEYQHQEEVIVRCLPKNPKKATILNVLNDPSFTKEAKLTELLLSLNNAFPKLKGDIVTFIGTTFCLEGQKENYLNHCIVLNTCDKLLAPNSVVEVYDTEREVLLAWTRLIQREQPDIVMGFNIFGFDYEFMFRRAIECNCVEEFLTLSKNKGQVCGKFDTKKQEYDLERSSITISTGTYDLSIIKMAGRLQVDLLNYFRRTVNMGSYKLDSIASEIIGDKITSKEYRDQSMARFFTKNMMGLSEENCVHFIQVDHSSRYFNKGKKYRVAKINHQEKWFEVEGFESMDDLAKLIAKTVRWGLSKDDVTPKDIFRLTHEGPASRMIVAKYCIQDCNLVHHLFNKTDVLTGLSEMSKLCSVPMSYLIFRGQGIKLTSFLAKKCRDRGVLMPVISKGSINDAYEGAIVLEPHTGIYLDDAIAVGDFASLYPSGMRSENICPSSKVWSKRYDLNMNLIEEIGEKNKDGTFKYDNLEGHEYVDITFKTYQWLKNPLKPKAMAKKIHTGFKTCRYEQTEAILPAILKELLQARKDTRKLIPGEPDAFMKNILNQRQLAFKATANSIYGQTGAKTSTFYDPDVAASTTAIGQKCLLFAKKIIEECYGEKDMVIATKDEGDVMIRPTYVYGDTDSVFFKLNCRDPLTEEPIIGKRGIKITIELSQVICNTVSKFLKGPHDFEYEKSYCPFIIPSKKNYAGEKYEHDFEVHVRSNMGGSPVKRDSAPFTRDLMGRITDVIMNEQDILKAIEVVKESITQLVNGQIPMDQLIISKSLGSYYKNPKQIAHKVLADRIAEREPGNKPTSGDRIQYIFVINPEKVRTSKLKGDAKKKAPKILQGDCIETPEYIKEHPKTCKIDFEKYITSQLKNPISQMFALALEDILIKNKKQSVLRTFQRDVIKEEEKIRNKNAGLKIEEELSEEKLNQKLVEKRVSMRKKKTSEIIFGPFLLNLKNSLEKNNNISKFFTTAK
jgi:DNA polymerase elongation subunit (family B)